VLSVRAKTTSMSLDVEAPRRLAGFQPHKAGGREQSHTVSGVWAAEL